MWGDSGGRDSRGIRGTGGGEERPGAIYGERITLRDIWDVLENSSTQLQGEIHVHNPRLSRVLSTGDP